MQAKPRQARPHHQGTRGPHDAVVSSLFVCLLFRRFIVPSWLSHQVYVSPAATVASLDPSERHVSVATRGASLPAFLWEGFLVSGGC